MTETPPFEDEVNATISDLASRRVELWALIDRLSTLARAQQRAGDRPLNPAEPMQIDLIHGSASQWSFWQNLLTEDSPARPVAVFPDFSLLITLVVQKLGMEHSSLLGNRGMRTRVVTGADQLVDGQAREVVAAVAQTGIEVRTMPTTPGWFYVDGARAVVPLDWHLPVPTSVVVTHDPTVVATLTAFFDDLWDRAQPPPGSDLDWAPVLVLASQGLSDGAIASTLDISLRTVRRRIADASRSYGVTSRFALGVEWERTRTR